MGPWRLLLSGRHDWLFEHLHRARHRAFQAGRGRLHRRAGLSYVTDFGLTPYVSYGTSFKPNPGTVLNGGVAKPTKGEQAEAALNTPCPATTPSSMPRSSG